MSPNPWWRALSRSWVGRESKDARCQ